MFGAPWPGKPFRPFQQQSITTQTAYRGRLTKTRSSGSSRQTLIFRRFGFPLQQISPEEASPQKRPSAKTPNRLGSKDICVQQRPTPRLRRDSGQSHPPRFPMARGVTTRMYSVSECVFPELSLRFFCFQFLPIHYKLEVSGGGREATTVPSKRGHVPCRQQPAYVAR